MSTNNPKETPQYIAMRAAKAEMKRLEKAVDEARAACYKLEKALSFAEDKFFDAKADYNISTSGE